MEQHEEQENNGGVEVVRQVGLHLAVQQQPFIYQLLVVFSPGSGQPQSNHPENNYFGFTLTQFTQ